MIGSYFRCIPVSGNVSVELPQIFLANGSAAPRRPTYRENLVY